MLANRNRTVVSTLLVLVAACGGGSDGGSGPPPILPVATVTVTLSGASVQVGQSVQATATLRDASGNTLTGRSVQWSSSNASIATVNAASGVVTGVAAGSVQITATSETRSGSADLSVTPDPSQNPQIAITSITANGRAIDPTKLAGPIRISLDETVPPGFAGTIRITLDTVELARVSVGSGSGSAAHARSATSVTTSTRAIDVTATPISVTKLTATDFDVATLPNISTTLSAVMQGTMNGQPVTRTATQSVTLANQDTWIGLVEFLGSSATGQDNNTWIGGPTRIHIARVKFSTTSETIQEIDVVTGPVGTLYGRTNGGVVNVQTKRPATGGRFLSIDYNPGDWAFESGPLPTTVWLDGILKNGVFFDPQVTPQVDNGYCIDPDADSFGNFTLPPVGFQTPQNCTPIILPDITSQLPAGRRFAIIGKEVFRYDGVAPVVIDPRLFQQVDRGAAIGQSPFVNGSLGNQKGLLKADHDFTLNYRFNASYVRDGGVGLPTNITPEYRVGQTTDLTSLVQSSNKWTTGQRLTASASYTHQAAVGIPDRLGQYGWARLAATSGNPNQDGSTSGPSTFRVVDSVSLPISTIGYRNRSRFNALNPAGNYTITAKSPYGFDANGISWTAKLNGQYYRRAGTTGAEPVIGGGSAGDSTTLTVPLASLFNNAAGSYELNFHVRDRPGFAPMGYDGSWTLRGFVDAIPPVIQSFGGIVAPFADGDSVPFQYRVSDETSVAEVGVRYHFPFNATGIFKSGFVNFSYASRELVDVFSDPLRTSVDSTLLDRVPHTFNLVGTGGVQTSVRLNAVTLETWDGGENLVRQTRTVVANVLPAAGANPPGLGMQLSTSGTSLCATKGCTGSPTKVSATMRVVSSTSTPPHDDGKIYVTSSAIEAEFACLIKSWQTSQQGATFTHLGSCDIDGSRLRRVVAGSYAVFGIARRKGILDHPNLGNLVVR
jgi:hypothetical protein